MVKNTQKSRVLSLLSTGPKLVELTAERQAQTNRPELFRDQALPILSLIISGLPSSQSLPSRVSN